MEVNFGDPRCNPLEMKSESPHMAVKDPSLSKENLGPVTEPERQGSRGWGVLDHVPRQVHGCMVPAPWRGAVSPLSLSKGFCGLFWAPAEAGWVPQLSPQSPWSPGPLVPWPAGRSLQCPPRHEGSGEKGHQYPRGRALAQNDHPSPPGSPPRHRRWGTGGRVGAFLAL